MENAEQRRFIPIERYEEEKLRFYALISEKNLTNSDLVLILRNIKPNNESELYKYLYGGI